MRKSSTIFPALFLCILFLACLTGCGKNTTDDDLKSKVDEELNYLDNKIVSILNNLNNISIQDYTITSEEISLGQTSSSSGGENSNSGGASSQGSQSEGQQKESTSQSNSSEEGKKSNIIATQMESKTVLESNENDIDWKTIKNEIERINEAWAVVILDLSNLNVDNSDILSFSSTLDDCILSIKDENKVDTLINCSKLYSIIPKLEKGISNTNSTQNIKQVKSYIINAYSLVEQNDWVGVDANIVEAEKKFKEITNDIEYIKNKEYKVNKTYVLIKELQNSLSYKDKKLFYVKYKNVLESINTL